MAGSAMTMAGNAANASAKAPTAQRVRIRPDRLDLILSAPAAIASVMSVLLPCPSMPARY
ncbi:hypothetical protein AWB91_11815 [Mycobacterium paraense]|uniref:Uncharacterized protein n=1 Tax=Mycobacterium paraense TaxID=767916 RepID=A0ABX3VQT0_9MYCO|nr:hypothetical protein AWB91_11815 [Mycobacterium paraense]ORW37957.1 hypothetical protein AWB88_01700 [Mycobacterium paraense]